LIDDRNPSRSARSIRSCSGRLLFTLLLAATFALATPAQERLSRLINDKHGLPAATVNDLAQDGEGLLWLATNAGLVRYDGIELRNHAPEVFAAGVREVTVGPRGAIRVIESSREALYVVTSTGVVPVVGPDSEPLQDVRRTAVSADGLLWATTPDGLLVRDTVGDWSTIPTEAFGGAAPKVIVPGLSGSMYASVGGSVWRLPPDRPPLQLFTVEPTSAGTVESILPRADGSVLAITFGNPSGVFRWRDGELETLVTSPSRGIDLVERGDTVWAAFANELMALRPGAPPEVLGEAAGINSALALLVDHEESLWVASFVGLRHFPEPETMTYAGPHGLPSAHARFLASAEQRIWVATWQGIGFLDRSVHPSASTLAAYYSSQPVCTDRWDRLWFVAGTTSDVPGTPALVEHDRGSSRHHGEHGAYHPFDCSPALDGTLWLLRGTEILRTRREGGAPDSVTVFPEEWPYTTRLAQCGDGRLYIAHQQAVCAADAEWKWHCDPLPPSGTIRDLTCTASGEIWVTTSGAGVLRRTSSGWNPVLESSSQSLRHAVSATPSPRGGMWIAGNGFILRVVEGQQGWSIRERLSSWNGTPLNGAGSVLEEEDGTVWLASTAGVTRVPASARGTVLRPPPVVLVRVNVDGNHLDVDGATELRYGHHRIELSFAALSYRDPQRIRYRMRLGPDEPWIESRQPTFRFVDLRPGDYQAEVAASLDGENWTADSARFTLTVHRPWFLQFWAWVALAATAAALLYGVHRLRVVHLVRLERQRTRIAMDLHDEMGSGLGSIGILAGLAADDAVPPASRAEMARKIALSADELGGALQDIIWSLGSDAAKLGELAARLADRGEQLFAADGDRFRTDFPEAWPARRLSLPVRRNALLVGLEALHNASRHAEADRVVLGLAPAGARWRLWVEDNGRGIDADGRTESEGMGLGLTAMRRRAEQIGAELVVTSGQEKGTCVELHFDLHAEDRRIRGRRRS